MGKNATPSLDKLVAFSEILGTTIDALSGIQAEKEVKFCSAIGTASCGGSEINFLQDNTKKHFIMEIFGNLILHYCKRR